MVHFLSILGTGWFLFSVWADTGDAETVFWAGILPMVYLIGLGLPAISDYYSEKRDKERARAWRRCNRALALAIAEKGCRDSHGA